MKRFAFELIHSPIFLYVVEIICSTLSYTDFNNEPTFFIAGRSPNRINHLSDLGTVKRAREEYGYSNAADYVYGKQTGFIEPCANDIQLTIMKLFGGFFKAGCSKKRLFLS